MDTLKERKIVGSVQKSYLSYLKIRQKQIIPEQNLFSGIGKGKWLAIFCEFNNNHLIIDSFCSIELLILLFKEILKEGNYEFILSPIFYLANKTEEKQKIKKLIMKIKDLGGGVIVNKKDIENKFIGLLNNKKGITEFLWTVRELLDYGNIELLLKNNNMKTINLNFSSDGQIKIVGSFNEEDINKIVKLFNSLFYCKNNFVPCYYLIYMNITKLEGGEFRTAVRHGEVIKEYGTFESHKTKKYKF